MSDEMTDQWDHERESRSVMKASINSAGIPGVDALGNAYVDFPHCGFATSFTAEERKKRPNVGGGTYRGERETAALVHYMDGIPFVIGHPPSLEAKQMLIENDTLIRGVTRDSYVDRKDGKTRIMGTLRVFVNNIASGADQSQTIADLRAGIIKDLSPGLLFEPGPNGEETRLRPIHMAGLPPGTGFCTSPLCGVSVSRAQSMSKTGDDKVSNDNPKDTEPPVPPAAPPAPAPPVKQQPEELPIPPLDKLSWQALAAGNEEAKKRDELLVKLQAKDAEWKDKDALLTKYRDDEKVRETREREEVLKAFRERGETMLTRDEFDKIYTAEALAEMTNCEMARMLKTWDAQDAKAKKDAEGTLPPADPALRGGTPAPGAVGDKTNFIPGEIVLNKGMDDVALTADKLHQKIEERAQKRQDRHR